MNKQSDGRAKSFKNYWNEVERICERCNNCILNEYTLAIYKKKPTFLSENWMLFCRCNGRGISKREAEYLELQQEYFKINYKLKQ